MRNPLVFQLCLGLALFMLAGSCASQIRPDKPVRAPEPPAQPAAPPAAPRGDQSQGEQVVRAALGLQGGVEKLQSIKTFESELDITLNQADGTLQVAVSETWAAPGQLRTLVKEADRQPVQTSWDGKHIFVSSEPHKWERLTPEEDEKGYKDIRENLTRIDRLLHLVSESTAFELKGRKLVPIYHVTQLTGLSRPFEFRNPDDPGSRLRESGMDERRLSILDVIEVERTSTAKPGSGTKEEPLRLFIDDTADSLTKGFVVGVSGRGLDGDSGQFETLWFRDFQPSKSDPNVKVPREIQIYRSESLDGIHEVVNLVNIHSFDPNILVDPKFFQPQ